MRWLLPLMLLAAPVMAADKTEEEAGDVAEVDKDSSGPLRDRVRPVSGHLFLMKGRFEISPSFGFSIKDAFFSKYTPELLLSFHFAETVGIVLRGGYAISAVSNAAQICETGTTGVRGCVPPTTEQLQTGGAYGQMGLLADLDLEWAPIYGKLALISEGFAHFNMYGMIGPSFVMYGPSSTFTVGGNVGLGFRFFFNKFLCLRAELRDVIYSEQRQGTLVAIGGESSVRNQLMLELGFSIFLPTDFTE